MKGNTFGTILIVIFIVLAIISFQKYPKALDMTKESATPLVNTLKELVEPLSWISGLIIVVAFILLYFYLSKKEKAKKNNSKKL